jgi:hypothetical protein
MSDELKKAGNSFTVFFLTITPVLIAFMAAAAVMEHKGPLIVFGDCADLEPDKPPLKALEKERDAYRALANALILDLKQRRLTPDISDFLANERADLKCLFVNGDDVLAISQTKNGYSFSVGPEASLFIDCDL